MVCRQDTCLNFFIVTFYETEWNAYIMHALLHIYFSHSHSKQIKQNYLQLKINSVHSLRKIIISHLEVLNTVYTL